MASATSKKTELKLTNVAKASLEELLLDYEDFLRQRRLPLWDKNSREALAVRGQYQSAPTDSYDPHGIAKATAEVAANTLICLINQATYLLKRQIENQGRDFVEHGGFTERLYQARSRFQDEGEQPCAGPGLPPMWEAHDPSHRAQRIPRRPTVLGLLRLPRLHRNSPGRPSRPTREIR